MPSLHSFKLNHFVLALDGVSDPGNLGTLLRTALALGWEGVYLLPHCCDPFNEKVVRAARGAQLKIPLMWGTHKNFCEWTSQRSLNMFVGDLKGEDPRSIRSESPKVLVIGSEAKGPTSTIRALCHPLSIPMKEGVESLNAAIAGSILLYLLGPSLL